jgi:hypothetical protein
MTVECVMCGNATAHLAVAWPMQSIASHYMLHSSRSGSLQSGANVTNGRLILCRGNFNPDIFKLAKQDHHQAAAAAVCSTTATHTEGSSNAQHNCSLKSRWQIQDRSASDGLFFCSASTTRTSQRNRVEVSRQLLCAAQPQLVQRAAAMYSTTANLR